VKQIVLIVILFVGCGAFSQRDSTHNHRKWIVGGTNVAIWGGSTILLNEIWYKDFPKSGFHTFNDAGNWQNMDKMGHAYAAYQFCAVEYSAWKWSGVKERSATWLAGGISWGYQMTVEVLDGFSEEWGFSWADVTANTAGSVLFVSQQLLWKEQRIRLKFGYKPSEFAALRPEILGATFPERLLKDYNAQSYWLTASPSLFFPKSNFPKWIQLAVGYSSDQLLKGDNNAYTINGFTYHAKKEYALSLDIDWTKLPIKRRWLKQLVRPLNTIRIPLPAVFWRGGVCYVGIL